MLGVIITNAYLTYRFESVASSAEVDYEDFSEFLGKLAFQMIHKFKPNATHRQSSHSSSSSSSSNTSAPENPSGSCTLVSITEYMAENNSRKDSTNYSLACKEPSCRNRLGTDGKSNKEKARTHNFCYKCSDLTKDYHNFFVFLLSNSVINV